MPEIPSIGHGAVGPINRAVSPGVSSASSAVRAQSNGVRSEDRVELSDHARLLERLRSLPEVRQDLINRVRDEIAGGTYESPEKLDEALQRLLDDLIA